MAAATMGGILAGQMAQDATNTTNNITNGLFNEGMGLAFSGINNSIQAGQNQRLLNQQLAANEQLSQFNFGQQLQMWQETNYPQQVQQMEQAGLNPALMYGMKGGGGATTGTPTGGMGMSQAPGTTPSQIAQVFAESANLQADTHLKEAQAKNIDAKTPQEASLMQSQIASITQGVQNQQAQQALTQVQTTAQQLANQIQGRTIDDQVAQIQAAASTAQQQFQIITRNNWMDQQTLQTKIDQTKASLIGTYINNNLQKSNIQVNQQEIQQMANQIIQSQAQSAINRQNANTANEAQQTNDKMQQLRQQMFNYGLDQNGVDQFMQGIGHILPSIINLGRY